MSDFCIWQDMSNKKLDQSLNLHANNKLKYLCGRDDNNNTNIFYRYD